ncbi:hypothetical protein HY642_01370 [Candidatus Woesearchaeota archaeon]|nr:hypothetical protein [Candidatus Woesearchaeota archaeon]
MNSIRTTPKLDEVLILGDVCKSAEDVTGLLEAGAPFLRVHDEVYVRLEGELADFVNSSAKHDCKLATDIRAGHRDVGIGEKGFLQHKSLVQFGETYYVKLPGIAASAAIDGYDTWSAR